MPWQHDVHAVRVSEPLERIHRRDAQSAQPDLQWQQDRRYQQEHRKLARPPAIMSRLMLTLDWKTSLRERVMRAFNSDPRLFGGMLAMHVGVLSPLDFAANGISLGWRMLTV